MALGIETLFMEQRNCSRKKYNSGNSRSPKMENGIRKLHRLCWVGGIGTDIYFNTSWVRISQGNRGRLAQCRRKINKTSFGTKKPNGDTQSFG